MAAKARKAVVRAAPVALDERWTRAMRERFLAALIETANVAGAARLVGVEPHALDAVKTYLRIDGDGEDSALSALIATAVEQCEAYVGAVVLQRAMTEVIVPDAAWQLLTPAPMRVISGVAGLAVGGGTTALAASAYEIDIDADGRGRVRFLAPVAETRAVVSVQAGLSVNWAGLPESLRHGIIRLVGHYHVYRDRADELGPPAAVAALWRGNRRVRLS